MYTPDPDWSDSDRLTYKEFYDTKEAAGRGQSGGKTLCSQVACDTQSVKHVDKIMTTNQLAARPTRDGVTHIPAQAEHSLHLNPYPKVGVWDPGWALSAECCLLGDQ
jgi:hypothetical protein